MGYHTQKLDEESILIAPVFPCSLFLSVLDSLGSSFPAAHPIFPVTRKHPFQLQFAARL